MRGAHKYPETLWGKNRQSLSNKQKATRKKKEKNVGRKEKGKQKLFKIGEMKPKYKATVKEDRVIQKACMNDTHPYCSACRPSFHSRRAERL